jgi:hypothetical protein
MTTHNLHTLNSSLLALPVVMIFTQRLLLKYKSPALIEASSLDKKVKLIEQRANRLTSTLKNIVGYNRHGLNE